MVVPVLITSCQVSEYSNIGPHAAHKTTMDAAMRNAGELPVQLVIWFAKRSKKLLFFELACCLAIFLDFVNCLTV